MFACREESYMRCVTTIQTYTRIALICTSNHHTKRWQQNFGQERDRGLDNEFEEFRLAHRFQR